VNVQFADKVCFPDDQRVNVKRGAWWVCADDDGRTVGFGGAWMFEGDLCSLERSGVLVRCRGLGLHKRLIAARVAWARRQGAKKVITYTLMDNPASSNNLMACKFKLYMPKFAWAGRNVLYWMRVL